MRANIKEVIEPERSRAAKGGFCEAKHLITELLSLPKEIVLNLPQVILTGRGEIVVENYKNIIEYTNEQIRINTSSGILLVVGASLILKQITAEHITITGTIFRLEYLR